MKAQNVTYDIAPDVQKVVTLYESAWENVKKTEGFRVQITSLSGNNSRVNAENLCKDFREKFPGMPCYIQYQEPHFKVRVGNFKNRLDALKCLQTIAITYPGAFVVRDKIFFTTP
jgi:hypothetical protein